MTNSGLGVADGNDKREVLLQQSGLDKIVLKPILEYGGELMEKKMIVKKIVNETEFIVYHNELRTNLKLKQIAYDEDLVRWI